VAVSVTGFPKTEGFAEVPSVTLLGADARTVMGSTKSSEVASLINLFSWLVIVLKSGFSNVGSDSDA
jgi:hypothetical protein